MLQKRIKVNKMLDKVLELLSLDLLEFKIIDKYLP